MNQSILQTPSLTTFLQTNSEDSSPFTKARRILSLGSLGSLEEGTAEKVEVEVTEQERLRLQRVEARPPLSEILNLHDFEVRYFLRFPSRGHLTPIQRRLRDSQCPRRRGHTILQPPMTKLPTARITPPSTGPYFF